MHDFRSYSESAAIGVVTPNKKIVIGLFEDEHLFVNVFRLFVTVNRAGGVIN